jgi:hypothetical protein
MNTILKFVIVYRMNLGQFTKDTNYSNTKTKFQPTST